VKYLKEDSKMISIAFDSGICLPLDMFAAAAGGVDMNKYMYISIRKEIRNEMR
jgi:hypothetical protein